MLFFLRGIKSLINLYLSFQGGSSCFYMQRKAIPMPAHIDLETVAYRKAKTADIYISVLMRHSRRLPDKEPSEKPAHTDEPGIGPTVSAVEFECIYIIRVPEKLKS